MKEVALISGVAGQYGVYRAIVSSAKELQALDIKCRTSPINTDLIVHINQASDDRTLIPSNVAEGHERASSKKLAQFLNYAKDSADEPRTQIYICVQIAYIRREARKHRLNEQEEIAHMRPPLTRTIRNRATFDRAS